MPSNKLLLAKHALVSLLLRLAMAYTVVLSINRDSTDAVVAGGLRPPARPRRFCRNCSSQKDAGSTARISRCIFPSFQTQRLRTFVCSHFGTSISIQLICFALSWGSNAFEQTSVGEACFGQLAFAFGDGLHSGVVYQQGLNRCCCGWWLAPARPSAALLPKLQQSKRRSPATIVFENSARRI